MTVADAAAYLAVSRRQVYLLIEREELPHVRVGERIRFIPAELRRYLDRNRTPEMREAGFPASEPLADENVNEKPSAA